MCIISGNYFGNNTRGNRVLFRGNFAINKPNLESISKQNKLQFDKDIKDKRPTYPIQG